MIIFQYDTERINPKILPTIHKVLKENLGEENFIILPKGIDIIYSDNEVYLSQGYKYISNACDLNFKNKNLYKGKTII